MASRDREVRPGRALDAVGGELGARERTRREGAAPRGLWTAGGTGEAWGEHTRGPEGRGTRGVHWAPRR